MTEETTRDAGLWAKWLRQAEADRDAYAAVAKAAMEYIECSREDCWACKGRIAPALDALTDEQKERIT